jgi:hypothetical protein
MKNNPETIRTQYETNTNNYKTTTETIMNKDGKNNMSWIWIVFFGISQTDVFCMFVFITYLCSVRCRGVAGCKTVETWRHGHICKRQPEINYNKNVRGEGAKFNFWEHPTDMRPPLLKVIFESTLRICDPHPSKSKLWTGLKQVKLHAMLIRIGAFSAFFRGDSEYGTLVAIWSCIIEQKYQQTTNNKQPLANNCIDCI